MEIYDSLLGAVCDEYDRVTLIKKSERGEVTLIRHRASGNRYIFRHFSGSSEVYRKLLTVSCPNLPQIMEVGEKEGKTALLEEYVQGDTLGEILQGGLLTAAQAKQITRQLCMALWVLHSLGVVHRDVKPDNVIIRGTEAVLIDFDASRIYKNENREDTQILGTTGFAAAEHYADWGTSLQETCQRKNGQDRPALYHGKSGEKIQEYPSSDGGFVKHKKLMVSGKKPVNL